MSEYDLEWFRGTIKAICGFSFLIVATCVFVIRPYESSSPVLDTILRSFLSSGVISGWTLVIIDTVLMVRGNEDG